MARGLDEVECFSTVKRSVNLEILLLQLLG